MQQMVSGGTMGTWKPPRRWRCGTWLLVLVPCFALGLPGLAGSAELVRWDWYFRESLAAIDDWETILAFWETKVPKHKRTPRFPVPADGGQAIWPNPIPLLLLPEKDRGLQVRMWVDGAKVAVQRLQVPQGTGGATLPPPELLAAGQTVQAYWHPGGGGKDQWYHQFSRRFDGLTAFQPHPAAVAVSLDAPADFTLGRNELALQLRNATDRLQEVAVRVECYDRQPTEERTRGPGLRSGPGWSRGPVRQRVLGEQGAALPGGASRRLAFPVDLAAPGGSLLIISVEAGGESYWLPLLTHVEDVPAVLQGIGRMLADAPDPAAAESLARLEDEAERLLAAAPTAGSGLWRSLFERASGVRDELLLQRIHFRQLLFVKRKPFYSEQPYMDAHHCYNRPGGGMYCLSPVRPQGRVTPVVDSLGLGIYRDICLHWEGERLVFAFGNGSDRVPQVTRNALQKPEGKADYDLYEVFADGRGLRQLTTGPKNDCEPFYLPNGQIGFTSDRSEHYVMCGSDIHVANLFVMNADGSGVRQLSHNVFNEFNPSVLPDGRIIYNRWEYNERSVTSLHDLFTMHPDGTHVAPFYGNATIRPNVIMFPRAVPGSPQVMALFTGHHGQTHGPIGLIDVRRGVDGPLPLSLLTPGVPVTGEKIEDSRRGWYSDPQPLSETTYLCSFTPTVVPWLEASWAIYVGDRHGNLALVYRDPEISCAEPVPLVSRPRPLVLPGLPGGAEGGEASLLLVDVYEGLPGVSRGTARHLRILEDVPRKGVPTGGVICTAGTGIYTVKRILGTVPIEADGSAHFLVPADRNVYFEVLDERHLEIQRMRSVVCLKPNESTTCAGCHEPRTGAPPARLGRAFSLPPARPLPPPWGTQTLSYLRDVQPVLNEKCVRCHTFDRAANGVILTDDLTDQFAVGYEELLPYLRVANAMRWDHPDDVYARPPYTYGSHVSALTQLLLAGHYGVSLTEEEWQRLVNWIDANAVYYDRYETDAHNRRIFIGGVRDRLEKVYARRCANCHGEKQDGRHDTWWMSVHWRDAGLSRALRAPLARAAGGWGRCEGIVFADTQDPDYQQLLAALGELRASLEAAPRADLLSLRGTPAERQVVRYPPPPLPQRPQEGAEMAWVSLSALPWQKASAGWTPNKDGLPRRNKDIEGHPLRLGARVYRQGIGTHAPSEIVYDLDGRYSRLTAVVGGGEANGTVVFQVYGDGQLLYTSGVLHGLRETERVDVSLANVRRLRLVVSDAGDGYISDVANWADAKLLRAPAEKRSGSSAAAP